MFRAENFRWLPNVLTSTRYVFAVFICITAANGRWKLALSLFAAALLTDFLDGLAAKKLNAKTAFGENFDGLADATLVAAGVLGLAFAGELSWWIASAVLIIGAAIGGDKFVLPKYNKRTVPRKVASVGSLFIWWIGIAWFFAALSWGWHWWYVPLTMVILAGAASLKRHRLRAWLGLPPRPD